MPPRVRCPMTSDLLDWAPPKPQSSFDDPGVTRAATLDGRLCRAMSLVMTECGRSRSDIAADMAIFLGEDISVEMLNAYTSEARKSHRINVPRLVALCHATGDTRPLSLLTEPFGMSVVPDRYLPLIEADMAETKARSLMEHAQMKRRQAGIGGRP